MSQEIIIELQFFWVSILWGALILLAYDQLRVIRRIISHNNIFITIQDIIFWILASIFIFAMLYVKNDGIIRGFSVMGMVIGMVLYHYILSDLIVMLISRGILLLLRPLSITIKYIRKGGSFLLKKGKNFLKIILKRLKKILESVKIYLTKYKQKSNNKKAKIHHKNHKKKKSKKKQVPKNRDKNKR